MSNLAGWTFLNAASRRGGGLAADLCFRGPARRAARPCSARRSDAHGARDQFASYRGNRRRLCAAARQRATGGNLIANGGIGIVSVRGGAISGHGAGGE